MSIKNNLIIQTDNYCYGLTNERLNPDEGIKFVTSECCGAVSLFLGTVRKTENEDVKPVSHLYYEAYSEMALRMMEELMKDLQNSDENVKKCYLVHRLGKVAVGEASILITASSAHRNEAHGAVMKILDTAKAKLPIWKQINYETESSPSNQWSTKTEAFWMK